MPDIYHQLFMDIEKDLTKEEMLGEMKRICEVIEALQTRVIKLERKYRKLKKHYSELKQCHPYKQLNNDFPERTGTSVE